MGSLSIPVVGGTVAPGVVEIIPVVDSAEDVVFAEEVDCVATTEESVINEELANEEVATVVFELNRQPVSRILINRPRIMSFGFTINSLK